MSISHLPCSKTTSKGKPYRVMKKKKGRSKVAEESCPCFSDVWNSHAAYLECIEDAVTDFAKKTQVKILKKAERSDCGKSVEEVCPCSSRWKNLKQYVSCITKAVRGLTLEKQDDIISDAEVSDCGNNIEETCPCNSDWDDHDEYMLCITDAAQGLDEKKQTKVVNKAKRSHCGGRSRSTKTTTPATRLVFLKLISTVCTVCCNLQIP